MTTADAFLADICANPKDDAPRLIFADWLEENGQGERGELIRVQCELAAMDECGEGVIDPHEGHTCVFDPCPVCVLVEKYEALQKRERELLSDPHNFCSWVPLFLHQGSGVGIRCVTPPAVEFTGNGYKRVDFSRGFIASLTCTAIDFLQHANAITDTMPIERVKLTTMPELDGEYQGGELSAALHGSALWMEFPQDTPNYEVILTLLKAEWGGVEFTLPQTQFQPWQPLRDARPRPTHILRDTGLLMQSIYPRNPRR